MRRSIAMCAVLAWCSHACAGETCVRMEFLDPSDGELVVRPVVSIDNDGLVCWSESGLNESRQARIGAEHLSAVIEELVESLQIGEIDSGEMWDEIVREGGRTGLSPQIEGAGITRIVVSLRDAGQQARAEVVVECPACHLLATRYPEVESLQRFAQCQKVLENLRAVMQVGGFDEANRLADLAHAYLAEQGHAHEPLSCRDLRFVRSLPGGAKFATFHCDSPTPCHVSATIERGRPPVFQIVE